MNESERNKKNERIAEIAKEILSQSGHIADYMGPDIVEAVDQARRAEYYERLGDRPTTRLRAQQEAVGGSHARARQEATH